MASLATVPVELLREIVQYTLDGNLDLPVVGRDAAWIVPPASRVIWKRGGPRDKVSESEDEEEIQEEEMLTETGADRSEGNHRSRCTLKSLRSVNRLFDAICQPYLYRELNLMLDLSTKKNRKIQEYFIKPKWSNIQSISVYMDTNYPATPVRLAIQANNVASILGQCRNLTTLALYYRQHTVRMMDIKDVLLSLFKGGRLSTLGVYSDRLMRDSEDRMSGVVHSLAELIDAIALDESASKSLKVLDVLTEHLPTSTFNLIRSRFTRLTSLTLRRTLASPWFISRVWDFEQRSMWSHLTNLTRLQLGNFEPGNAAQIAPLVGHFTALEELVISACGNDAFGTVLRPTGWSKDPGSLCNTHKPLKSFWIEHMDDYEIYELGLIPTTTLIVTTVKKHHLLINLRRDAELFPGLKVLRLSPLKPTPDTQEEDANAGNAETAAKGNDASGEAEMNSICTARGIEIRRDAHASWTCVCTSAEGY